MLKEYVQCPLCDSKNQKSYIITYDRFNISELFNIVKCKCDFVFLNPRPIKEKILSYYKNPSYIPLGSTNKSLSSKFYFFIQSIAFKWKFKLINILFNSNTGRLFDIGSGKGEFRDFMLQKNWNVDCYEPTIDGLDFSKYQHKHNIYDLITMWHSLEHIHNLEDVFSFINNSLKSDGYLMIAVPNINAYEKKFYSGDILW